MKKIISLFLLSISLFSTQYCNDSSYAQKPLTRKEAIIYQALVELYKNNRLDGTSIKRFGGNVDDLCELLLRRKHIVVTEIKQGEYFIKYSLNFCKGICGISALVALGGTLFFKSMPTIDSLVQQIIPVVMQNMNNQAASVQAAAQNGAPAPSVVPGQPTTPQQWQAMAQGLPTTYTFLKKQLCGAAVLNTAAGIGGVVWSGYKLLQYRDYIPQRRQEIATINDMMKKLLLLKVV